MAKKDFSQVNTGNIYSSTIAEATGEQEEAKARKERRAYTPEEVQDIVASGMTSGRKGCKLPRINMAFSPDSYEYIKVMSRAAGLSLTDFVNLILRQHMESHEDLYKQALDFRAKL